MVQGKSKISKRIKHFFLTWGGVIFSLIVSYCFLAALVLTLKIPIKVALIAGLTPLGVILVLIILLFGWFKWSFSTWRKHFNDVSTNEGTTTIFKTALLPCLLVVLYFFINANQQDNEEGQRILYTISPVRCEMIVHPCGSSYKKGTSVEVWDSADLISQPSSTEVFVITNALEMKQTRSKCPQTGAYCSTLKLNPGKVRPSWLGNLSWTFAHQFSRAQIWNPISCPKDEQMCEPGILYDNGIQTDICDNNRLCTIEGWCPPVTLEDFSTESIFETQQFSIFLDMRPNFTEFSGPSWTRGGEGGYGANYADIYSRYYKYKRSVDNCLYHRENDPYCPRFLLKDIVTFAGENYTEAAAFGGQFRVEVHWDCNFDWGMNIFDCLPEFKFINREHNKGKPKLHSQIAKHEDNTRTVTYSLGLSISIDHIGKGLQIQMFNSLFYAQFIYISYAMIKGPVLWLLRCIYASFLTATVQDPSSEDGITGKIQEQTET